MLLLTLKQLSTSLFFKRFESRNLNYVEITSNAFKAGVLVFGGHHKHVGTFCSQPGIFQRAKHTVFSLVP